MHPPARRAIGARALLCLGLVCAARTARGDARAADSTKVGPQGLYIRHIVIDPREIFDPLPDGPLHGFYGFANTLHMRTRTNTVRTALVIHEGERLSLGDADESLRKLRALGFLIPEPLRYTENAAHDSVDITVTTHDNWTTSPQANLESAGGQRYGSFSLSEGNLAGLGSSIELAYHDDPVGISREFGLENEALFGTHVRLQADAGNGASGDDRDLEFGLPFWAEATPVSALARWHRSHADVPLFAFGQQAATFRRRTEETVLSWGTGRRASDGLIQRFIGSFESLDREFGESQLQPGAPPAFGGGVENLRIRRVAGEMFLWRPHYIIRRGVDQIDRDEDFDLGPQFAFKGGLSPQLFGGTQDEGYVRLRMNGGHDAKRLGFGYVRSSVETRLVNGFRETLGQFQARLIEQPRHDVSGVFSAIMIAGDRMPRDFQLVLGGLTGLRAFPIRELSGTEIWRMNGEVRWAASRDWLNLVSFGGAAFWDSGRAWGPGAEQAPWHHDAGFGLRVSLPHSTVNSVARFDIAWPIAPTLDGKREPVFSFGSGQAF